MRAIAGLFRIHLDLHGPSRGSGPDRHGGAEPRGDGKERDSQSDMDGRLKTYAMKKRDKGRFSGKFLPVNLLQLSTLILLPAFLPFTSSCTESEETHGIEIHVDTKSADSGMKRCDIFIYGQDGMLDSYSRPDVRTGEKAELFAASTAAAAVCIVNSPLMSYRWEDIRSLERIRKLRISLEEEDAGYPVMSAEKSLADLRKARLDCRPLLSSVVLRSLRCDFSGKGYGSRCLKDVRFYLTGACTVHSLLGEDGNASSGYMNIGGLDLRACAGMRNRDFIYRDGPAEVGSIAEELGIEFLAYPDSKGAESPGSPYTRLVIEGRIDEETFYWPITLNRKNGGRGLEKGTRMILDVTLTRKGSDNPWTPVDTGMAEISAAVLDWNEKEVQDVVF